MIGVWATAGDGPASAVLAAVGRCGVQSVFLDEARVTAAGPSAVMVAGRHVDLLSLTGLYLRPNFASPPELWTFADEADIPVINRPSSGITNASKPFQAALIAAAGFSVPDTLITTSVSSARRFVERHQGQVVYKSISAMRSIVTRWTAAEDARITDVHVCPTQLQERIPPPDFRIHVVGSKVFGCVVRSDADDYRFASRAGLKVEMKCSRIPTDVADRAVRLTHSLGLIVSGLDLRQRTDGTWCCFEVNPSPAFTFYEPVADEVAAAIAGLLGSR